jgi:hypothetical protein
MKPLPKEFQFKCDEHSLEQCKKLGIINKYHYTFNLKDGYYFVLDNIVIGNILEEKYPIISLADYIESETTHEKSLRLLKEYISETPKEEVKKIIDYYNNLYYEEPDHSELIVELTGKYVAAEMFNEVIYKNEKEAIKTINKCISLAEETVKQLKEKRYL